MKSKYSTIEHEAIKYFYSCLKYRMDSPVIKPPVENKRLQRLLLAIE